jgi:hypothetical protein
VKEYKISVISDFSYKGSLKDIEEVLTLSNNFFIKYKIKFVIVEYMKSNVISSDLVLESTLDEFCNCNVNTDITLAIVGKHRGSKLGVAFLNGFKSDYSRVVVDFNSASHDRLGVVLTHEILHLMGLQHSDNKNNIMCHITIDDNITSEQEKLIIDARAK